MKEGRRRKEGELRMGDQGCGRRRKGDEGRETKEGRRRKGDEGRKVK
jgi:hypothetical protein